MEMLSVKDVAKLLKVSKTTVYTLIKQGDLQAIRIGNLWRIKISDLRALLTENET